MKNKAHFFVILSLMVFVTLTDGSKNFSLKDIEEEIENRLSHPIPPPKTTGNFDPEDYQEGSSDPYVYDEYQDQNPDYDRNVLKPMDTALAAMYGIITVVGLVANGVVFFVIFGRNEISRTVTAIYVLQLAVADSIFLFTLPIFGMQKVTMNWTFGEALCTICQTLKFFNYFAGIFFLTAMSVDRYIAVAYSTSTNQLRTKRRTLTACSILWMISAVMSLPITIFAKTESVDNAVFCRLQFPGYQPHTPNDTFLILYAQGIDDYPSNADDTFEADKFSQFANDYFGGKVPNENESEPRFFEESWNQHYTCKHRQGAAYTSWIIANFIVGFVIPFIIITISYVLILKRLQSSEEKVANMTGKKSATLRKKVTRTVASLVICFAICWLPYHIFMLIKIHGFKSAVTTCVGIEQFVLALGFSNSAFNPILYTFLGHNFKLRFLESIRRTKKKWRRSSLPSATGKLTRSHSDHASVPFSKKIGNMVAFRKASRTSIPFEQEHNLGREKLSTFGEKRIKCMVPLMDLNKKKEQICGSSLHTFDQNEPLDCISRTNQTEFTRVTPDTRR